MDYSASIHETDDPAGASPWGNSPSSSPRQQRSGFETVPAADQSFPYASQSSDGLDQSTASVGNGFHQEESTTSVEKHHTETETSTLAGSGAFKPQPPPQVHQQPAQSVPQQQTFQPPPTQGPPAPNAEQIQQAQAQRPPQPQYKLQAKITGLERTGKKDPLLRFDVHVSIPSSGYPEHC